MGHELFKLPSIQQEGGVEDCILYCGWHNMPPGSENPERPTPLISERLLEQWQIRMADEHRSLAWSQEFRRKRKEAERLRAEAAQRKAEAAAARQVWTFSFIQRSLCLYCCASKRPDVPTGDSLCTELTWKLHSPALINDTRESVPSFKPCQMTSTSSTPDGQLDMVQPDVLSFHKGTVISSCYRSKAQRDSLFMPEEVKSGDMAVPHSVAIL